MNKAIDAIGRIENLVSRLAFDYTPEQVYAMFSGLLFCSDCGSVMYQQRYQMDKRRQDCYICGSYKKRTADCTAHFIRNDLLTAE